MLSACQVPNKWPSGHGHHYQADSSIVEGQDLHTHILVRKAKNNGSQGLSEEALNGFINVVQCFHTVLLNEVGDFS